MKNLFITVAAGLAVLGSAGAQDAMTTQPNTNVSFHSADGTSINAYLAAPSGTGRHPAVLMIHEWWGLNQDMANLADALAAEGFVVLATDTFRGSLATTSSQAMTQMRGTPQEQIAADLNAALEFLRAHRRVRPNAIATMGFCFGGTQSFLLGTRATNLAAVVTLYGSGISTDAHAMGNLVQNAPVLGIFGAEDGSIPASTVQGFKAALDEIGAEHTVSTYQGVGHAFVKSSTYQDGGAAQRAWRQVVGFLKENVN